MTDAEVVALFRADPDLTRKLMVKVENAYQAAHQRAVLAGRDDPDAWRAVDERMTDYRLHMKAAVAMSTGANPWSVVDQAAKVAAFVAAERAVEWFDAFKPGPVTIADRYAAMPISTAEVAHRMSPGGGECWAETRRRLAMEAELAALQQGAAA